MRNFPKKPAKIIVLQLHEQLIAQKNVWNSLLCIFYPKIFVRLLVKLTHFFAKQKKAKFFKKVKFLRANELRKNAKFSQNKLLFSMEIGHLAKVLNCTNVKWIFTQLKG